MSENRKQLVLDAMDNKETPRVPTGFWHHFVHPEYVDYRTNPAVIQQNVDGHQQFFRELQPDLVKLMCDGFFVYPNDLLMNHKDLEELKQMKPLGPNNDWITKQVELAKAQIKTFTYEVATFFNIFSPTFTIKFMLGENSKPANVKFADWIMQNKEAVKHAINVMAEDVAILSQKIITEGGATGIYFCVQNVQDERITKEIYDEIIYPAELKIFTAANEVSKYNIYHICGYAGARNDLSWYLSFPARIISFATNVEGVSLSEFKKMFNCDCVIGGYANTKDSVLYKGTKEEIQAEARKILNESGRRGMILGADCSLPFDIDINHLIWAKEATA